MFVVGLTGGLATGKSTVANFFGQFGAKVFDADKIARQLLWRNGKLFPKIVKAFGKTIVKNGRINRKRLAEIVFVDNKKRRRLERLIHPLVIKAINDDICRLRRVKTGRKCKIIVVDVPLLFESGMDKKMDFKIVVSASRAQQLKRAKRHLGLTNNEALNRIAAQMPLEQKIRQADMVIWNNNSLKQTREQARKSWEKILGLVKQDR